ncbi:TPA: antirestriction protein ArdA [Streptococcus suis]
MKTRVYITNLGKYNEGELVGKWIDLPISQEELQEVFNEIGINDQYEEYFITDYEAAFDIGLYDSIEKLNRKAEVLKDFDSLHDILQYVNSESGALDHLTVYENDEEFFETFFSSDPFAAVKASYFGEYRVADEYVGFNGYGNLVSYSDYSYEKMLDDYSSEIIEALFEVEF